MTRQCPICGGQTRARDCCGVRLGGPFHMTGARVKALRAYAHGRKGLDQETYRLHLHAVGVDSTLHLDADRYNALLARLRGLPDAPRAEQGRAAR